MKVLVADDDPVTALMLHRILSKLGHQVTSAANGKEALELFLQHDDLQVVLSDWMMPEMDGLELCRRVRARRQARYTYVLIATTRSGKQNCIEALDAGADDFITKPVDAGELAARLRVAERTLGVQAEIRQLQGLLSICTYCKRIRDGEEPDARVPVEGYVSKRSQASFSHGICPGCLEKHFAE